MHAREALRIATPFEIHQRARDEIALAACVNARAVALGRNPIDRVDGDGDDASERWRWNDSSNSFRSTAARRFSVKEAAISSGVSSRTVKGA